MYGMISRRTSGGRLSKVPSIELDPGPGGCEGVTVRAIVVFKNREIDKRDRQESRTSRYRNIV